MDIVGGDQIHTCTDTLKEVIREAAEFWSLPSFPSWNTKLFITFDKNEYKKGKTSLTMATFTLRSKVT